MTIPDAPLVIVNPVSGPAAQRALDRRRLGHALAAAGLEEEWVETTPERDAGAIVDSHDSTGPVVVVGGDGTIRAAVRALRGTDRPLAVVPRGSGNILARRMDIPHGLGAALQLLRRGRVRRLDLGICDDEPFLLAMGFGIDARVIHEADQRLKQQLGKLAYVWGAARNLPLRHHDFTLRIDGVEREVRACSVMAANVGTYIGPWVYPPRVDPSDARLEVAMMRAETLEQGLDLVATPFFSEEAPNRGVEVLRGRSIEVRAREEMPFQVDGEALGRRDHFRCEVEPEALSLLVPED